MVEPRHGKALFVGHGGITPLVGELNMLVKQPNKRKTERKVNSTTSICVKIRARSQRMHARAPRRTRTQHEADVIVIDDGGRKKAGLRRILEMTFQILFWAPHHDASSCIMNMTLLALLGVT